MFRVSRALTWPPFPCDHLWSLILTCPGHLKVCGLAVLRPLRLGARWVLLSGGGWLQGGLGWGRDPRILTHLSIRGEPPGIALCNLNLGLFVFPLHPEPLASWASV